MAEMSHGNPNPALTSALEAVANLWKDAFTKLDHSSGLRVISAHSEIKERSIEHKSATFYRSFVPLRTEMITLLADSYRRYFKLALAHPSQTGGDPTTWAWIQLQPALHAALAWMFDWYVFACDGESRRMHRIASFPFEPGKTVSTPIPNFFPPFPPVTAWRAPAWLFQVSLVLVGIGVVKTERVPNKESVERLGPSHTRLILKGAKRVFLWNLGAAIEMVRNEEIAAAGAVRTEMAHAQARRPNKRKGWEQRLKLYGVMRKILSDDLGLQGMEFCAELDRRHAPPLLDWMTSGKWREGLTWKEAWSQPHLRNRIRRVRQEAQKKS
jgi:hypothetical protein